MKTLVVPICVWLAIFTGGANGSRAASPQRFQFQQRHMGTVARIVVYAADEDAARAVSSRAFARIAALDAALTDYRDTSELMQLSASAGGPPQRVSDDLFRVLAAAQAIAVATDGAFDATVGPVSRLWRKARAAGTPPGAQELAAATRLVNYRDIELSWEYRTVRLARAGMGLDLGGIGKGFAADEAMRVLRAHGARSSLVVIGGDVVAGDAPPGKDGWQIAIAPLGPGAVAQPATRTLGNVAISTSGDAEQFLEHEGTRYSHVVDPRDGQALTGRRGVTVIARDGATADALATALSVAGPGTGLRIVDRIPGAAALFADEHEGRLREQRSTAWR